MKTISYFLLAVLISFSACKEDEDDHCKDGILNFDETGIDCGGNCPACAHPTCTDGIQNQNETAIDCGGPCNTCTAHFTGTVDNQSRNIQEGTSGYILTTAVYSEQATSGCSKDFYAFLFNSGQKILSRCGSIIILPVPAQVLIPCNSMQRFQQECMSLQIQKPMTG